MSGSAAAVEDEIARPLVFRRAGVASECTGGIAGGESIQALALGIGRVKSTLWLFVTGLFSSRMAPPGFRGQGLHNDGEAETESVTVSGPSIRTGGFIALPTLPHALPGARQCFRMTKWRMSGGLC
jgi:hypothetical protein